MNKEMKIKNQFKNAEIFQNKRMNFYTKHLCKDTGHCQQE